MTDAEYQAALTVQKDAIKAYINSTDSSKRIATVQILLSTLITNAGSSTPSDVLTNLTGIHAALDAALGSP